MDFIADCGKHAKELVLLNKKISDSITAEYLKLNKKNVPWWLAYQWRRINEKAGFKI